MEVGEAVERISKEMGVKLCAINEREVYGKSGRAVLRAEVYTPSTLKMPWRYHGQVLIQNSEEGNVEFCGYLGRHPNLKKRVFLGIALDKQKRKTTRVDNSQISFFNLQNATVPELTSEDILERGKYACGRHILTKMLLHSHNGRKVYSYLANM